MLYTVFYSEHVRKTRAGCMCGRDVLRFVEIEIRKINISRVGIGLPVQQTVDSVGWQRDVRGGYSSLPVQVADCLPDCCCLLAVTSTIKNLPGRIPAAGILQRTCFMGGGGLQK